MPQIKRTKKGYLIDCYVGKKRGRYWGFRLADVMTYKKKMGD